MSSLIFAGLLAGTSLVGPLPSGSVTLPADAPVASLLNAALPDESFDWGSFFQTSYKSGTLVTPGQEGGLAISCSTKSQMTRVPMPPVFQGCTIVTVADVAPDATTLTIQDLFVLLGGTATP